MCVSIQWIFVFGLVVHLWWFLVFACVHARLCEVFGRFLSSFRLFSFCSVFIAHCVNRPAVHQRKSQIFRFINRKGQKLNEKPDQEQQISRWRRNGKNRQPEENEQTNRRKKIKKIFIIIMPNQITKQKLKQQQHRHPQSSSEKNS